MTRPRMGYALIHPQHAGDCSLIEWTFATATEALCFWFGEAGGMKEGDAIALVVLPKRRVRRRPQ